ncbi:hypothetical protein RB595_005189 [Gaeumannomyces hyphopodioides]
MSTLDVEALLENAAANADSPRSATVLGDNDTNGDTHNRRSNGSRSERGDRSERRDDRDSSRDRRRRSDRRDDRNRDGGRSGSYSPRSGDADRTPRSDAGSHRSGRRRSQSRDRGGRRSRRNRGGDGDFYRGGRGGGGGDRRDKADRSRSRSPNRYYRPRDGRRDRDDDHHGGRGSRRGGDYGNDRRGRRAGSRGRDGSPAQLTEDERDRRTVFVQQLAARLRTKELHEFFEQAGPVAAAQIVKDRVSNRSKGVGYVEFKSEESLPAALQLTGQKLAGIPVIVQPTEAEKNRQVRTTENSNANGAQQNSVLFHRLYVGNIHFSITEPDLRTVFGPFGELRFVQLQKDDNGRSRGYGFVEYNDPANAREALEKMNGFDLAGRPIRVGLGNDKFTPESTANIMQRYPGPNGGSQGPGYSGRNGQANGLQSSNFDRAGGRDSDKGGGASALDDTDVAGVNFNSYSRDALMRKLARTDEASTAPPERQQILKPKTEIKPLPVNVNMASRCVLLKNMFDPAQETGEEWIRDLESDVREEAEKKYGHVVHISVDPNSNGDIYLKFDKVQGGENAIKGLNGRYFGGNIITAAPVVDAVYSSLFARTKAI